MEIKIVKLQHPRLALGGLHETAMKTMKQSQVLNALSNLARANNR